MKLCRLWSEGNTSNLVVLLGIKRLFATFLLEKIIGSCYWKFLKDSRERELRLQSGLEFLGKQMFRQMCMPPPMHEAGRAFILHVPTYYPVCRFKKKTYYAVSAWIPSIRFWDHKLLVTDEFKLVCSKFDCRSYSLSGNDGDLSQVSEKILLFENDDQLDQMLMNEISQEKMKSNLLQEALNESLCSWLLQKIAKGVKDPNVLDESGRGILHFEASLGYNLQLWV